MSQDILLQIVSDHGALPVKFSIQLDESTDVSNCSQLLVFVRYVKECAVHEEFLFCERLLETTKAIDVLQLVKAFFTKHGLNLQMCGSICTDGAPAMLGNRSGFAALMKKEVPNIIVTHCILHRHALVSKCLPAELKNVMSIVVRSVNFIRGHALNHRLFQHFCQKIGSEHSVFLFLAEIRWLSRGRVLTRVMELHKEIAQFFQEKGNELADNFKCQQFILSLAYLADSFTHLNELNISMQGSGGSIMTASQKLSAFIHKLPVWKRRIENCNFANFPNLDSIFVNNQEDLPLVYQICTHLEGLMALFDGYFPNGDLSVRDGWICDRLLFNLDSIEYGHIAKDELIELKGNQKVKMKFDCMELTTFWCHQL